MFAAALDHAVVIVTFKLLLLLLGQEVVKHAFPVLVQGVALVEAGSASNVSEAHKVV